jgi:hypothetical protein
VPVRWRDTGAAHCRSDKAVRSKECVSVAKEDTRFRGISNAAQPEWGVDRDSVCSHVVPGCQLGAPS